MPNNWPEFRRIAYAGVVTDNGAIVGLCHENIDGYTPTSMKQFKTYDEAQKKADELNAELGLAEREALLIVLSTMKAKPRRFLIGTIQVEEDADTDVVMEIVDILTEEGIANNLDDNYIHINSPLGTDEINPAVFEQIETLLQKKGYDYSILVKEFQETGKRYEGGSLIE